MTDRTAFKGVEGPGQPRIKHAGRAGGIGRDAKMWARRKDRREEIGGDEENLGIDIPAGLLVMAEKADVMFKQAELQLGDDPAERLCRRTGGTSGTEHGRGGKRAQSGH